MHHEYYNYKNIIYYSNYLIFIDFCANEMKYKFDKMWSNKYIRDFYLKSTVGCQTSGSTFVFE